VNLVQKNLIEDVTLKEPTRAYITFGVQTKSHGHGDVHMLLPSRNSYPSGIAFSQCWNYM